MTLFQINIANVLDFLINWRNSCEEKKKQRLWSHMGMDLPQSFTCPDTCCGTWSRMLNLSEPLPLFLQNGDNSTYSQDTDVRI